jgi:hypothetical protein
MSSRTVIAVGVVLIGLLFLLFTLVAPKPGVPILFVLPDGYRGAFYVMEDPRSPTVLRPEGNRFTIRIPSKGVLKVKSMMPISGFHRESAQYAGGGTILSLPNNPPDQIALYQAEASGAKPGEPIYGAWVVGTRADLDRHNAGKDQRPAELTRGR